MTTLLRVAMFAAAPLIAGLYENPALIPITQWLSLTLLFGGLKSVSQGLLTRDLLFRRLVVMESACGLFAAGLAVYLAFQGFGVWSLVTNLVLSTFLQMLIAWWYVPPRFTLRPEIDVVKNVLRWGTPVTGSALLFKFYDNADYLVVGKVLGKESLGFYTLAFRLATIVNEKLGAIISRVSFPTFAAMQENRRGAVRHWLSITRKSALISFPVLTILAVNAPDIVSVILGEKWLTSVGPLRLLCIVGFLRAIVPVTNNLLAATGRTDMTFQYTLMNATLMPAAFYAGCKLGGIVGVGIAWIVVFPFICAFQLHRSLRLFDVTWREYLRNLRDPLLLSISSCIPMLLVLAAMSGGLARLVVSSALTGAILAVALAFTPEGEQLLGRFLPARRVKQQSSGA
jgi:O-antigen/teichoic acid export membrane protein